MTKPQPQRFYPVEVWPIDQCRPHERNYNQHPAKQLKQLRASLRKQGQYRPIVVRPSDRQIIGGHGVWEAAKLEGWTEIQVVLAEKVDDDVRAILVGDNEIAKLATTDDAQLASLLQEIRAADGDLEGTGHDDDSLEQLLHDLREAEKGDKRKGSDDAPEPRKANSAISKAGEVYQLGPHRLICGDSTDPAVWAALMQGDEADLVWSDPPYGVAYVGGARELGQEGSKRAVGMTLENDDLNEDQLESLLSAALGCALKHCNDGASWYIAAPAGPLFLPFAKVLRAMKVWRQTLVWAKSSLVLGRSDFHYRHEAIFYGWKPGAAHRWQGDRKQDTLLEFDKPARNDVHPTMKPVALVQHCIALSSSLGDIVVDCFGGSGTTLIASDCESRVARLIELDPWYCDVIRRRYRAHALANGVDPGAGALE